MPGKVKSKHKIVKKVKSKSLNLWMVLVLALAVLLVISVATGGFGLLKQNGKNTTANSQAQGNYNGKKVTIVEYSDFQCPYCKSAEDSAVATIRKNFGNAITWDYREFPLSFHPLAEKAAEAAECARDQGKFWEYHDKLFAVSPALEVDNLKKYAKDLGLDTAKFNTCLDTGAKASLVAASEAEGQQKGVSGTPAFFIDGQLVSGAQPYDSFLPVICKSIPDHPVCANAPKPASFKMYIIEDKRCATCDSTRISGALSGIFTGMQVQKLDYSSTKGKELYDLAGLVYLPMYVFDSGIKNDPSFTKIQPALAQKGDYYIIQPQAVGSTFDPNGEICDNKIDDNNDGLVDCADSKCATSPACNKKDKPTVELFVMSYCPYGTQSEKGILPAVRALGDKIDFKIRFVSYAMHGLKEVKENLNQYCIQSEQPDKYLKYLACFLNDSSGQGSDSAIASCIAQTGIETTKLDACKTVADSQFNVMKDFNDKSSTYPKVEFDAVLNIKYGVQGSPTLIINGVESDAGRDSASYLAGICASFNTPPAECNTQLSSTPPGPGFGYDSVGSASAAGCGQ